MPDELFPIGRFARLCRLSVKQLRHYDDLGLLRPAHVDPGSGYRYYTRDQTRAALTIGLLRTLDVPLAAIADLLAGDEQTRQRVLSGERDRIDAQLRRQHAALRGVERLMREGLERRDISLSHEPALRVAVQRGSCTPEDIGRTYGDCVTRLLAAVDDVQGPPMGLYPLDLTPALEVAAAVPTQASPPGVDIETLPATPAAVIVHIGPFEELSLTYNAVLAWIHEHGHTPQGPVRETYLSDPATTESERFITRVAVPVTAM
ncbi:MerR family transcriptional regulator [Allokutzneria albata]|uniref:DNA-binding transcriptional regulator, MerR family n=1 Tax=Allokutzneria albata TaxID=211114 RepID=A0A1G9T899_ALLAB|nr:MerR family transcriptional regulator [Allokutzneria albata]SDM43878.1 DNA-binding transcriptional regulator, MerR family [Allokutzneria albata]